MPTISGPLKVVTEDPAVVTAVWVQARELRPHGAGAILPQRARATIDAGAVVTFECVDGPAVLIWQVGSVEGHAPILVTDETDQTLASVVRAAQLAEGRTADELAALVAQVVRDASSASAAAGSASSSAESAASARDTAVAARDEAVTAAGSATGAASTSTSARDAAVLARNQAADFKAQAATSATNAADDASAAASSASAAGDHATAASGHAQAAFVEADRSSSEADRAEAAAQSASTGVMPDTVGRLHLTPELRGEIDGKAPVSHDHTASEISDATTVGRNVLTASSQAAARQAIGAGTSNLALGTTSSTAARGNHTHTAAQVGAATAEDVAALQAARTTMTVSPPGGTTTLVAPTNPVAGQMHIFEVLPTANTTITVSALGPLADGVPASLTVEAGDVGLIGLRWSSSKASWHVLTASVVK